MNSLLSVPNPVNTINALLSSPGGAIILSFDSHTRIAGEMISGVVQLNFQQAQKENIQSVRIKFRGMASTRIVRGNGQRSTTYRSFSPIVREDLLLWRAGSPDSYPAADTHHLELPFSFRIPENAPGSFYAGGRRASATVSYALEVVADRPGIFQFKRRVGSVFPVLPVASTTQARDSARLTAGWDLELSVQERTRLIRQRIWGDYAKVDVQLSYPALQSYPVGVPIPFSIVVTTRTKLTLKSDVSSETLENLERAGKALFPAPPVHPLGVRFSLERTVRIKARATRTSIEENVHALSGLGPLNTQPHSVAVSREEPVWLSEAAEKRAENDEKGWWQRQTQFDSSFTLSCTPTLDLGIIVCSYELSVEVPFPGIGNNLALRIPIHINSGIDLMNSFSGNRDPSGTEGPPGYAYARTHPALDLPPAYFTGEFHDWDADGKS